MLKRILILLLICGELGAQELYPYSEPASNMPSNSLSVKQSAMLMNGVHSNRLYQRHITDVMFGLNKNWMVHGSLLFSDMHEKKFIWEGARSYVKYRFHSVDDVHKHFRMAAFVSGAFSRNHLDHNELNLADQSGIEAGLIATQLWNRFAISATGGIIEVLNEKRSDKMYENQYAFQAVNYSLSGGLLVLPVSYTSYDQTNLNLYVELLGSRNIDFSEKYFIDLAPSIQFIFKSTGKLNIGYRFELGGDIYRFSDRSFMISYEHIFLNALRRKVKARPGEGRG